jgi:hypothetical protein
VSPPRQVDAIYAPGGKVVVVHTNYGRIIVGDSIGLIVLRSSITGLVAGLVLLFGKVGIPIAGAWFSVVGLWLFKRRGGASVFAHGAGGVSRTALAISIVAITAATPPAVQVIVHSAEDTVATFFKALSSRPSGATSNTSGDSTEGAPDAASSSSISSPQEVASSSTRHPDLDHTKVSVGLERQLLHNNGGAPEMLTSALLSDAFYGERTPGCPARPDGELRQTPRRHRPWT